MAFDFYALTEQEKVDLVKDIAKRYGLWIVFFLIIFAIFLSGWTYWRHHQSVRAETASHLYQSMLMADQQKDFQKAESFARALITDYEDLSYANWAAFYLVKQETDRSNFTTAKEYLNGVLKHQLTPLERNLAFLRLAEIHMELGELEASRDAIEHLDPGHSLVRGNIEGDLNSALGHPLDAEKNYQKSLQNAPLLPLAQEWLHMKLMTLPGQADQGGGS